MPSAPLIDQLGYLALEVRDLDRWRVFATDILGLQLIEREDGFDLRNDAWARRILVRPGELDDAAAVGWQAADASALETAHDRLKAAEIDVAWGSDAECAARGVQRMLCFTDPGGTPTELFVGPEQAATPFESALVPGGFVAGDLGFGHIVLSTRDKAESVRFYTELLGFLHSDDIQCEFYGYPVDITFLHVNPRHHSLALGSQMPKRVHHFLLEAVEMDDVGKAYDRAIKGRVPIINMLGRHPNDRMFSFYAQTPSGIEFEFGFGGLLIDDAVWAPTVHDRVSDWGHLPWPRRPKPKA
jgi:biphenyl-2,3-diol 1,2-dioxygenase/3,4-dihydroxy-9,10-secoandrosta-1,3,5(10)-triene-9,17-dione 4,5-dioxygenase